ncbi:lectin beta-1 and beta-2 chains-like [Tripterygium wilfordii]|uniref:lectin beta-1 and beta-2 chains-like n=1 Tax=Tripterygium wilfordii TaxID=458696 RepID=UPI0018F854FC|nr:lectin beta-1 and beta-2 chains-like [Tripterygium wilfordii]
MFVFVFLFAFLNQASSSPVSVTSDQASSSPVSFPFPTITRFSFPSFTPTSCIDGNLTCTGSATSYDDYLSLTPESQPGNPTLQLNQVGRVLYKYPLFAWPARFYTRFTFRILTSPYSTESADGLTFIMAPNSSPSPADSFGSYLGIMDPAQDGRAADQLAVEFDTYKNTFDLDGNHVSIDTKSVINPISTRSLNETGIDLKSGKDIKVSIILNGGTNSLTIYVGYASKRSRRVLLNVPIDIPHTLPSFMYVGFTASTGYLTGSHQILSWRLSSYPIPKK